MSETNQSKPSLWRALHSAFEDWSTYPQSPHKLWSVLILAFADWLVPESLCHPYSQTLYHEGGSDTRLRFRNELLAEAARAEKGE